MHNMCMHNMYMYPSQVWIQRRYSVSQKQVSFCFYNEIQVYPAQV